MRLPGCMRACAYVTHASNRLPPALWLRRMLQDEGVCNTTAVEDGGYCAVTCGRCLPPAPPTTSPTSEALLPSPSPPCNDTQPPLNTCEAVKVMRDVQSLPQKQVLVTSWLVEHAHCGTPVCLGVPTSAAHRLPHAL